MTQNIDSPAEDNSRSFAESKSRRFARSKSRRFAHSQSRRFAQCDVFTNTPTKGNGLAVIIDGDGLSDEQMQSFAAWTNLAETTFLLAPTHREADYRVRIFTPTREMPFAGHPTLGSCAVWLNAGGKARDPLIIRQECEVGIVEIMMDGDLPAFVAPPTKVEAMNEGEFDRIVTRLEIDAGKIVRSAQLDNGPVWQVLELQSAEDVFAIDSFKVKWPEFKAIGLIGAFGKGSKYDYAVRMLAPSSGMSEDPITGSLNSAIAGWMHREGRLSSKLLVSQGTAIGREGEVHISLAKSDENAVLIGGNTLILIEGQVEL